MRHSQLDHVCRDPVDRDHQHCWTRFSEAAQDLELESVLGGSGRDPHFAEARSPAVIEVASVVEGQANERIVGGCRIVIAIADCLRQSVQLCPFDRVGLSCRKPGLSPIENGGLSLLLPATVWIVEVDLIGGVSEHDLSCRQQ